MELGINQMHDTRLSDIKTIKTLNPNVQTVYIKPPAKRSIPNMNRFADVSLNTDYSTIKLLSEEAQRQNKLRKNIIMIEMGELREEVIDDSLVDYYEHVYMLPNIKIIGIGTNINCLNGIIPNLDKLLQLCLVKN